MEFENENTKYKLFVAMLLLILVVFGVFVGFSVSYNSTVSNDLSSYTPSQIEEDLEQISQDNTETVSTKTYDIEVIYIDNYTLCNEKVETNNIIYSTTLEDLKNKELEKQQNENKVYEIKEESNERLIFERTLNQNCPNHFFVILEDKNINVYNVITKEKIELYQTIDISEELIRAELQEELTKGILVDSKEELNLIIEDIES